MAMEKMRTAEEMLSYFYANKTGGGMGRDKSLACFKLIERRLEVDEYALITFTASHYNENLRNEGYYGHAVTNKRILMAKQDSEPAFKMIPLSEYNGITVTCGKYFASILLDAAGMQLRVETTMPEAKR